MSRELPVCIGHACAHDLGLAGDYGIGTLLGMLSLLLMKKIKLKKKRIYNEMSLIQCQDWVATDHRCC